MNIALGFSICILLVSVAIVLLLHHFRKYEITLRPRYSVLDHVEAVVERQQEKGMIVPAPGVYSDKSPRRKEERPVVERTPRRVRDTLPEVRE